MPTQTGIFTQPDTPQPDYSKVDGIIREMQYLGYNEDQIQQYLDHKGYKPAGPEQMPEGWVDTGQTPIEIAKQNGYQVPEPKEDIVVDPDELYRKIQDGEDLSDDEFEFAQQSFRDSAIAGMGAHTGVASLIQHLPEGMQNWFIDKASNLASSTASIVDGIVDAGESVDFGIKLALSPEFRAAMEDPETRKTFYNAYYSATDEIDEFGKNIAFGMNRYSSSIGEQLLAGDILGAVDQTTSQMFAGAPSIAMGFLGPAGAVLQGISAYGNAFEDDVERDDASLAQLYTGALSKGAVEGVTEYLTGRMIQTAGLGLRGGLSRGAAIEYLEGTGRAFIKDFGEEGLGEGLSSVAEMAIDSLIYGDEFNAKDALTGFFDSFLVGGLLGGGVNIAGRVNGNNNQRLNALNNLRPPSIVNAVSQDMAGYNALYAESQNSNNPESYQPALDAEIQRIVETNEAHAKVIDSMSESELKDYASDLDFIRKTDGAISDMQAKIDQDPGNQDLTTKKRTLEAEKAQAEARAESKYDKVKNFDKVAQEVQDIERRYDDKIEDLNAQKADIEAQIKDSDTGATNAQQAKLEKIGRDLENLEVKRQEMRDTVSDFRPNNYQTLFQEVKSPRGKNADSIRSHNNQVYQEVLSNPESSRSAREQAVDGVFANNKKMISDLVKSNVDAIKGNLGRKSIDSKLSAELSGQLVNTIKQDLLNDIESGYIAENYKGNIQDYLESEVSRMNALNAVNSTLQQHGPKSDLKRATEIDNRLRQQLSDRGIDAQMEWDEMYEEVPGSRTGEIDEVTGLEGYETRLSPEGVQAVLGPKVEFNIGLENNPADYNQIINRLKNVPGFSLKTSEQHTGEYEGNPERTAVIEGNYSGDPDTFTELVRQLSDEFTQEAIAATYDGQGDLVWGTGVDPKYDFDPQYFLKPGVNTSKVPRAKLRQLSGLLNLKGQLYKSLSPYKKSKIDHDTRMLINDIKAIAGNVLQSSPMTEAQIDNLTAIVSEKIKNGYKKQRQTALDRKAQRDGVSNTVKDIISETKGAENFEYTDNDIQKINKGRMQWFNNLKSGEFSKFFSGLLSPSSVDDFEGLLYRMIPQKTAKDAKFKRNDIKEFFTDKLLTPVAQANHNWLSMKSSLQDNLKGLAQRAGLDSEYLGQDTGITVGSTDFQLTNSQAAMIYNYIKNPKIHKQLNNAGINTEKMAQIIEYVQGNSNLRTFADGEPEIYQGVKSVMNAKLDQHGYKGVDDLAIPTDLDADQSAILNMIYEGDIPTYAPYTPIAAKGADTSIEIDKLQREGHTMYSVMSGNLQQRSYQGSIDLTQNIESNLARYGEGALRSVSFLDFAKNASDVFTPANLKAMKAAYGDKYVSNMKHMLEGIVSGKNQRTPQTDRARQVEKWVNRSVGGTMFFNFRSGILQTISMGNFAVDNPGTYFDGIKNLKKHGSEATQAILDSKWWSERGKGKADVATSDLFDAIEQKRIDKWLQNGYAVTKMGDKGAILAGGIPFVAGRLSQGATVDQAIQEFSEAAEAAQQSSRIDKLGREQKSTTGKMLLAFANTPMQYNRKMAKALQELTAEGKTKSERAHAATQIAYYGAIQNAMFTALQQGLAWSLGMGQEEDEKLTGNFLNGIVDTILRGSGMFGAIAATGKNLARLAISKAEGERVTGDKVAGTFVGASPALGTKLRQLLQVFNGRWDKNSELAQQLGEDNYGLIARGADLTQFLTNVPSQRLLYLMEQFSDAFNSDLNELQRIMRTLGWTPYSVGVRSSGSKKGGKSPFGPKPGGKGSAFSTSNSPFKVLEKGEAGQAHNDGTIEVDPNLSPEEKAKTIAHEKYHVQEMEAGRLGYDDDSVFYRGKNFPRKDGKIEFNGKWLPEGDESLPWEAEAYEAEKHA